jgi:hypothetical protein
MTFTKNYLATSANYGQEHQLFTNGSNTSPLDQAQKMGCMSYASTLTVDI